MNNFDILFYNILLLKEDSKWKTNLTTKELLL